MYKRQAQKKTDVYYNLLDSLPQDLTSTAGTQKLRDEFDMPTTNFILVSDQLSSTQMDAVLEAIETTDGINSVATLDRFLGAGIPEEMLPEGIRSVFNAGGWKMIMANSSYTSATHEQNAQITELENRVKAIDPTALVTGEGALNRDLVLIADHDIQMVNIVSILAVFLIIAISFKSLSVPIVLVAAIEMAITINMGIPYFQGETIPFIASIVIGTIQLGATIDYAILTMTRYQEERRRGKDRKAAVQTAVYACSSSILTSGLSFFAATVGVSLVSKIDLIRSLCGMLARGALISMAVILLVQHLEFSNEADSQGFLNLYENGYISGNISKCLGAFEVIALEALSQWLVQMNPTVQAHSSLLFRLTAHILTVSTLHSAR